MPAPSLCGDTDLEPAATTDSHLARLGWRQRAAETTVVALLALVASSPSLRVGFVWDDGTVIWRNEAVRDFEIGALFTRAYLQSFGEASYRPVVTLSYLIDHRLWGLRKWPYHAENMALHALCAALVLLLARHVASGRWTPLAAGALFAVHPIMTEAVNAASFREDLQCAALFLAALLAMRRAMESARAWPWLVALFLSAASAGLAKETALVLPAAAVLFDLVRRGRRRILPGRQVAAYAVLGAAVGSYACVRFWLMYKPLPASVQHAGGSLFTAALTFVSVFARELRLIVLSAHQSAMHATRAITAAAEPRLWVAAAVGVVFVAFAAHGWRKSLGLGFGLAFFAIALGPVSGLAPISIPLAERYLYLPMAGMSIAIASALFGAHAEAVLRSSTLRLARAILFVLALVMLSVLTVHRTMQWTSDLRLWASARLITPDNLKVVNNLGRGYSVAGSAFFEEGNAHSGRLLLTKGLRVWQRAAEQWPKDGTVLLNIGKTYEVLGNEALKQGSVAAAADFYELAEQQYVAALQRDPPPAQKQAASRFLQQVRSALRRLRGSGPTGPS